MLNKNASVGQISKVIGVSINLYLENLRLQKGSDELKSFCLELFDISTDLSATSGTQLPERLPSMSNMIKILELKDHFFLFALWCYL
ncbi:MAG: hypothetical protein SPI03_03590 [Campylobacter sputorum]|uniref:hypothetical protein n=1 Tax=Campylobacter sputorum TaxID=206 RepID=UPI001E3977CD|nr:hypothetical protein [Campylobacter sputorum]ASM38503.1 hypothetical protein CSPARA_0933 [Campylobacter sputorum bv. paraureolyticus LMG 11764]MDY6120408.1 hypothetical protein [Campylobacter sputorum]